MRIALADIVADIIADVAQPLPLSLHASFTEQDPGSELCRDS
jgi:hypothetical protein